MSTLYAIGITVAWGSAVCAVSLASFSLAVACGFNAEVAPRTWARPKYVIKNVLKRPYGLRWVSWALNLTYKEMLEGIPGTGTRKSGWSGSLLKSNLDGIIVCKFNALCLRVSAFATFLCILITLPLNYTAPCDAAVVGQAICTNLTQLSDFEQTTLAHIPPYDVIQSSGASAVENSPDAAEQVEWTAEYISNYVFTYFSSAPGITSRLFGVVIVAWCIYIYSCRLIWNEWIDNLAMRRAYYLERDHYEDRKEELDYLTCLQDPEDPVQESRPPYVPHPELRETVPCVCLYSVLYKLPERLSVQPDKPGYSKLDRQLSACVDFFDKCVPNQPGFSSSVAAVTILPDASQVTTAWKKWFDCAAKLRRLRFIRQRIDLLEARGHKYENKGLEGVEPFLNRASRISPKMNEIDFSSVDGDDPLHKLSKVETDAVENAISFETTSGASKAPEQFTFEGNEVESGARDDKSNAIRKQSTPTLECIAEHISETLDPDQAESLSPGTESSVSKREGNSEETCFNGCSDYLHPTEGNIETDAAKPSDTNILSQAIPARGHRKVESDSAILSPSSDESDAGIPTRSYSDTPNHPLNVRQRRHFVRFSKRRSSQMTSDTSPGKAREEFLSDDGIEQLSVYCREFSQSSAGCCPYGCDEITIRIATLEKLEELEEEAEDAAREANKELIEAREAVNHMASDGAVVQNVRDRRSRQLSLLNEEVESSSDDSSSSSSSDDDEEAGDRCSEIGPGRRKVKIDTSAVKQRKSTAGKQWHQANKNLRAANTKSASKRRNAVKLRKIPSGRWYVPSLSSYWNKSRKIAKATLRRAASSSGGAVKNAVKQSTYAVVTFTSRQAAIAARQCLADGVGWDRWAEVEDIPVPPLADGPAWNVLFCRAFCKPVTLTLNDNEKKCRNKTTIFWLTVFCMLYSIPISYASDLLSKQTNSLFPELGDLESISGILSGMLYSLFFSVCPLIFKAFANYGSGATSIRQAEYSALKYYWVFILVTAYAGNSLVTMVRNGLYSGVSIGAEAQEILRQVAATLPTQIAATWLNWILVRVFSTLPLSYLLQLNTIFFSMLGMKCCARLMSGGGPGGPMPYRVYVDSGTVFLCIVALAPVCPLVAPAAMLYFLVFAPMIRWLLIFVYRPDYDGGGLRWPLIHDIFVSSLIVAQILLTSMMVLKKAYGPAFMAAAALLPTYIFGEVTKDRFLRSYMDAGLLQTSELDGWDTSKPTSKAARDEYRRWLVDAHKAAFVPICLAGLDNFLTMEPAVVIPTERDADANFHQEIQLRARNASYQEDQPQEEADHISLETIQGDGTPVQRGALFRRTRQSCAN